MAGFQEYGRICENGKTETISVPYNYMENSEYI